MDDTDLEAFDNFLNKHWPNVYGQDHSKQDNKEIEIKKVEQLKNNL